MKPFLSIGIPTYKRPLRLKHILTTLANQLNLENADWEVVVSDNCSNDDTPNVVKSFENKLPITYVKHETNKGPDFNFRSLADSCKGEYLWFVPDDDDLVNESSVSKIIGFIKNTPLPIGAAILNYKSIVLDTHEVLNENMFERNENVYLPNGQDVLKHIEDVHLLTGICLILKREVIRNEFVSQYSNSGNLSPMAMSLTACAKLPVLIIGEPLIILGAGDSAGWRKYWSSIYLQSIPNLLLHAQTFYGWEKAIINNAIKKHKSNIFKSITWHFLLLQSYDMKWQKMAKIYGIFYTLFLITISPFMIIRSTKIGQKIFGSVN